LDIHGISRAEPLPSWSSRWKQLDAAKPVAPNPRRRAPKKVKDAQVEWPNIPDTNVWHAGAPVVEAVVETDGTVKEVKFLRGFEPTWPEAEAAIINAIRKWQYEPVVIDGEPVPACMKVVININWQ
jgi:hypothetical protein